MLPKVFARLSLLFTVLALKQPAAHAQRAQQPKALVIDGVVREIFRKRAPNSRSIISCRSPCSAPNARCANRSRVGAGAGR
ncbi:MAG: hypothetical protein U1F68_06920 [Gammaproteobacteria bacterium]